MQTIEKDAVEAQQACMMPEPQKEHAWLQKLVGEWTYEHEAKMGPDQPPMTSTGTESVRSLGGLWVSGESQCTMPDGTPGTMVITLGYDPQKGRFVGTFVGSMMTFLWLYEGSLDAAGKVLTLDAEGPDMMNPGKMVKYQDIIELVEPDLRVLRSQAMVDGKWQQFMTATYRRTRK